MVKRLGKNLKGKTIVVYGASSNIGRRFTEEAAKRGAIVIAAARNIKKIPNQKKISSMGSITVIQTDITKKIEVDKALRENRNIDITVNFAADFSANITKARKVNIFGEQNILDSSMKKGVRRHIYISTIATQIPKPNPYRDTKLKAEELVKAAGKKGLEWVILRYGHVLGTPTWNQPFKIILPILRIAVPKVPTDAKKALFPYTTIETVVEATLAAVESRPNKLITVVDQEITIGEYLSKMEKIYNVKFSFLPYRLLALINKLLGKYFPSITWYSSTAEFLANPPLFENKLMKEELKVGTRNFNNWIKVHFSNI